ncbi:hypothetical protein [Mycoplasmopsis verecunda]|nr:hypothetical protein [Mycoplasmopsis verecunda]WPB54688.1 hypothetical protein SAM46_00800 [Mycoplasmopsis verecunda]
MISVKYYESILKKLEEVKAFNYKITIIIPDLYYFYNYHLMLLDEENENLAKKRIKNLHLFLQRASKLNANFHFTLDFHNIASFSDVLSRIDIENLEEKTDLNNNTSIKYNDLLYTQVIKIKKDADNELYQHIEKIYRKLNSYIPVDGFMIKNLADFCLNKQNQVQKDDYVFLNETFYLIQKNLNINISLYEKLNANALFLKKHLSKINIFTKVLINPEFSKIIKNIEKLLSKKLCLVFDPNKFLANETGSFSYKDIQMRIILEILAISSPNFAYYYAYKIDIEQWKTTFFDYLLLQENINNYFISTLYKRNDILKYSTNSQESVNIHTIGIFNVLYNKITIGQNQFKFTFRYQTIHNQLSLFNKFKKHAKPYEIKWIKVNEK